MVRAPMPPTDRAPVRLRRAVPADAPALTDLALRSKRSNGHDDAFVEACREELTVTAEDLREGECWVADEGGARGFAMLRPGCPDGVGEVHALFVEPDRQRTGIGRALWDRLVERARARGFTELRLDADPAAVPFYRSVGLETIGESPSGSIPGRMLPRMAGRLNPLALPARTAFPGESASASAPRRAPRSTSGDRARRPRRSGPPSRR